MFKIHLKDVGRGKVTKTIQTATDDPFRAEEIAYKEVCRHLMSKEVELTPNKNPLGFDVFVGGFRKVGEVTLEGGR